MLGPAPDRMTASMKLKKAVQEFGNNLTFDCVV